MTRRYVTARRKPRAEYDDDEPHLPELTVYEPDPEPQDTGLLDQHGNPLYAIDERAPIGFDPKRWR